MSVLFYKENRLNLDGGGRKKAFTSVCRPICSAKRGRRQARERGSASLPDDFRFPIDGLIYCITTSTDTYTNEPGLAPHATKGWILFTFSESIDHERRRKGGRAKRGRRGEVAAGSTLAQRTERLRGLVPQPCSSNVISSSTSSKAVNLRRQIGPNIATDFPLPLLLSFRSLNLAYSLSLRPTPRFTVRRFLHSSSSNRTII